MFNRFLHLFEQLAELFALTFDPFPNFLSRVGTAKTLGGVFLIHFVELLGKLFLLLIKLLRLRPHLSNGVIELAGRLAAELVSHLFEFTFRPRPGGQRFGGVLLL